MTVINQKAIIAACTEFGARIGEKLDYREGDAFDVALKACLAALSSKPIAKKASTSPSSSKLEKIAKKRVEIQQLGGTVDENVTVMKELNAIIKDLKAVKKAEEKAVKDNAKAEEKAKKAEEKAAKKAIKAASKSPSFPKDDWRTAMFPNEKLGKTDEWAGKNGKRLRIAIHKENGTVKKKVLENWTDKSSKKFDEMFPDGKFVAKTKIKKKIKKKAQAETIADEQAALIAKLVAPTGDSKNSTENPNEAVEDAKAKAVDDAKAKAAEDAKAAEEDDEDVEDVEEELEEIEVEEPTFPGEEEVDEFEHDSLEKWDGVDFYKDEDDNVWDENKDFVGTYDEDESSIAFKEDYEPEE